MWTVRGSLAFIRCLFLCNLIINSKKERQIFCIYGPPVEFLRDVKSSNEFFTQFADELFQW